MGTFLLIMQFLPMALQVVSSVEELVKEAKSGSVKKDAALKIVSVGLDAAVKGGALHSDDAKTVQSAAPDIVDGLVGVLNGAGIFNKTATAQSQA